ncbi:MAG: OmpH family outer membrane protein [Candidatus Omnitrophica bacterium]|nr:OmpH family outer membrane protein [Candidatus Omnitrophota bacterium]
MKRLPLITILALALAVVGSGSYAAAQTTAGGKIGYVNLSRLFDEYYKTKQYDQVLQDKQGKIKTDLESRVEKIKETQGKLNLLSADKKGDIEKQLEQMKGDFDKYQQDQAQTFTKERNEKIREILLEIEGIVKDFAGKEGYSVILNDRVLIFGDQTMDVTEQVLKKLNAAAPAKAAAGKK